MRKGTREYTTSRKLGVVTAEMFDAAKRKYNEIMRHLCYDHLTIGTELSEETDDWNLRDMVAECDYILSTFYEEGHCNYELREYDMKEWRSQTGKIRRFIEHWVPYIWRMKCTHGHCSTFDTVVK